MIIQDHLLYKVDPADLTAYCLVKECMSYLDEDFQKCLHAGLLVEEPDMEGGYGLTQKGLQAIENYGFAMPECICQTGKVFRFFNENLETYGYSCKSCGKIFDEVTLERGSSYIYAVNFGHIHEISALTVNVDTEKAIKNAPAIKAPDKPNVFAKDDKEEIKTPDAPSLVLCNNCGKTGRFKYQKADKSKGALGFYCKFCKEKFDDEAGIFPFAGFQICPECGQRGILGNDDLSEFNCIQCKKRFYNENGEIGALIISPQL